jgi:hypothetical protein
VRSCENEPVVHQNITNGELILVEKSMGQMQALALQKMLVKYHGDGNNDRVIEKLVIDDCSIKDKQMATILNTVMTQGAAKVIQISNNCFKLESMASL